MELNRLEINAQHLQWRTGAGNAITVARMEDDHLMNCIRRIVRDNRPEDTWCGINFKDWFSVMHYEADKRGLIQDYVYNYPREKVARGRPKKVTIRKKKSFLDL